MPRLTIVIGSLYKLIANTQMTAIAQPKARPIRINPILKYDTALAKLSGKCVIFAFRKFNNIVIITHH
jgi:hypothetical protein